MSRFHLPTFKLPLSLIVTILSAIALSKNPMKGRMGVDQLEFRVQASTCSFRRMNMGSKLKLEL
jgi:hypothetical protein